MIISKKRYQEEIAKAVAEARKQDWLDNRINDVQRDVFREVGRLEELIRKIEARVMGERGMRHAAKETNDPVRG